MRFVSDTFITLDNWIVGSLDSAVATGNRMKTMGSNGTWGQAYTEGAILNGCPTFSGDFSLEVTLEWEELDGGGNARYHEFYVMLGENNNTGWHIIAGIQKNATNVFFTANIGGSYINCPNSDLYNSQYNSNSREPVYIRVQRVSGIVYVYENSVRTGGGWTLIHQASYTGSISKIILTNTTWQQSGDIGGPYCRGYSYWSTFRVTMAGVISQLPKYWRFLAIQTATPLVEATIRTNWLEPYVNASGLFKFEFMTPVQNTNWEQINYGTGWGPGPWPKLPIYVALARPESPFNTAVYAGGSIYQHASVMCHGTETDQVMGLRILHEMIHCTGVDSDQMCNLDAALFGAHLTAIGDPHAAAFNANPSAYANDPDVQTVYYQWLIDTQYWYDFVASEVLEIEDPSNDVITFTPIMETFTVDDNLNTWNAQYNIVSEQIEMTDQITWWQSLYAIASEVVSVGDSPVLHQIYYVINEVVSAADQAAQAIHMRVIYEFVRVEDSCGSFKAYLISEIMSIVDFMCGAGVAEERVAIRSGDDPEQCSGHDEFGLATIYKSLDEFGNVVVESLKEFGSYIMSKVHYVTNTEVQVIEQIAICEETVIVTNLVEQDP